MGVDVVGLRYCVYDVLAVVQDLPRFDEVTFSHVADLVFDGGGQVGTALTALARLGARAGYVGVLGDDNEGHWLTDLFMRDGVDVSHLRLHRDVGTNVCVLLVENGTGRRAILCHQHVQADGLMLDGSDREFIQSARVLHLDGQFMPAAIRAAGWALEAGVKICYDGNHPRPGLEKLLRMVDWLVVADAFLTTYTGHSDPAEAASSLLALGPEILVVTCGPAGCSVWTADGHFASTGFVVPAVDTTGAGDAFHGAFIYAMLQRWSLERAASFANAVAALNCLRLGGRRGLPTLEQAESFLTGRGQWTSSLREVRGGR